MMQETLEDLGLSRRESICYIKLLELGSTKTGRLVKESGIPSSKIYEILNKLISRGLASYIIIKGVKHYQASDPKTLLSYMEEKRKSVENIIPQLLIKQKFTSRQSVELYEGQKAVFSLFTTLIADAKTSEEYLIFSIDEENKSDATNLFFKNLTVRRKEKKLNVKLLKNKKYLTKEKHTKINVRYTNFDLPQGITIFRNTTILLSWEEQPSAVKIESAVISRQLRNFFLQQWKLAE